MPSSGSSRQGPAPLGLPVNIEGAPAGVPSSRIGLSGKSEQVPLPQGGPGTPGMVMGGGLKPGGGGV